MDSINPRKLVTPKRWSSLSHHKKVAYNRLAKGGVFGFKLVYKGNTLDKGITIRTKEL